MQENLETGDWITTWEQSSFKLFQLVQGNTLEEIEDCGALLSCLRKSRRQLDGNPAPNQQFDSLAQGVLEELWKAATLSLYGELLSASTHIGTARRSAETLQRLINTFLNTRA